MTILIACEESQVVCKALRKLGYEAFSCDTEDCSGGHTEWHIKDDVLNHLDDGWDMMIAHPPCDRLSNAGVRWLHTGTKTKTAEQLWKELEEGAEFYRKLRDAKIKKKAIENPVMHKHAHAMIGQLNRQIVQPWWFGDKAFKATGFELIGLPKLKPTNKLIPPETGTKEHKEWSFIHRMTPGKNRKRLRSVTFQGVADAIASQWGQLST